MFRSEDASNYISYVAIKRNDIFMDLIKSHGLNKISAFKRLVKFILKQGLSCS